MQDTTDTQFVQKSLLEARSVAEALFDKICSENMLVAGIKESELNERVYQLAEACFGIKKHWHKRIVRTGKNTLCPYNDNPPDLTIQDNDVVFLDFGPIFDHAEADLGRTYVLGENPQHRQLLKDLKIIWNLCHDFFIENQDCTGRNLYTQVKSLAEQLDYQLGDWHCGHLIGMFPHYSSEAEKHFNYICPANDMPMRSPDAIGNPRFWILEVHLTRPDFGFGGFVEDLLLPGIHI